MEDVEDKKAETPARRKVNSRKGSRKRIVAANSFRGNTSSSPAPDSIATPSQTTRAIRIRLLHKKPSPSAQKPPTPGSKAEKILTKVANEQSLLIAVKNYRLPDRFPERFETFGHYKNDQGLSIPLLHRDLVAHTLQDLDKDVQPVLHRFRVYYSALSEGHPHWRKAAITNRIRLQFDAGLKAFAHHIQLRVRSRSAPNDAEKFYNRCTLLAVLFHELAHIRHMNHGEEFMFFLRDIYKFARKAGLFRTGEEHQLPSCRAWENALFKTGGRMKDEELRSLAGYT